jgi:Tfp pilus assembly protein PilZ
MEQSAGLCYSQLMDNSLIVNSIGIGGAIFVGLILFWFVGIYLKKRLISEQSNIGDSLSKKISWKEKRQHPRIAISWQAVIEKSGRSDEVQLRDISLGGAFVACRKPLALNERFKISISIPDQGPLGLNAEVVWSNINISEDKVVNRGMGIRFIENEEKDRRKLQEAITASVAGRDSGD